MPWLQQLVCMESVPACVHEALGQRLRDALKTETDVQLLLPYLEYLARDGEAEAGPGARGLVRSAELASDVAVLVLRRRVLVQHLSKLPGASAVLARLLLTGICFCKVAGMLLVLC